MRSLFKIRYLLAGLLVFAFASSLFAQKGVGPTQVDIFPPAPTSAALGKFADIPVSLYSGTPQIDIPIWEVNEGKIKVPVSLSYHASGIRVQEISSWVGLGWALNAGGVITRTVRGLPDEATDGFLYGHPLPAPTDNSPTQREAFKYFANGYWDSQPDIFSFNFGGRTGKFQLNQSGQVFLVPFQKIKVEYNNTPGKLNDWTITTEDGFVYKFDVRERSRAQVYFNATGFAPAEPVRTSSWFLSKITAPSGESVTFEYELPFTLPLYKTSRFETDYTIVRSGSGFSLEDSKGTSYNELIEGIRLKKIKFSLGEIEFVAAGNRCDLPSDKYLDQVIVRDYKSNVIRKFKPDYRYMFGSNLLPLNTACTTADNTKYRLVLYSLQEMDGSGTSLKPPHVFSYANGLPDRISNALDHWGFYNGQDGNTTLVPRQLFDTEDIGIISPEGPQILPGAIREPSLTYTLCGTLNKITYPTGGSTSFSYELHDANRGISNSEEQSLSLEGDDLNGQSTQQGVINPKSKPFTISAGSTGSIVVVNVSNLPCNDPNNPCGIYYTIAKNINGVPGTTGTDVIFDSRILIKGDGVIDRADKSFNLPSGDYFITLQRNTTNYNPPYTPFSMSIKWFNTTTVFNIGGLRLKRMEDFDPTSNQKKVKLYEYSELVSGVQKSTGRVGNLPKYGYGYTEGLGGPSQDNVYFVRSSMPSIPMAGLTSGSHVGYGLVTEYDGEEANTLRKGIYGKSTYKFTTFETFAYREMNPPGDGFPFSPGNSRDWMNGALLEEVNYRYGGNDDWYPVKKTVNEYNFYDDFALPFANPNVSNCRGLKVGFAFRFVEANGPYEDMFSSFYFNFYTGYKELIKSTEYFYDNDITKFSTKETKYTYSLDHLQLVKSEATLSNGRKLCSTVSYTTDYSDNSGFIQDLKTANILNTPIEKVEYETEGDGSNVRILSGEINTYKTGGKGLKDAVYLLETSSPIALSSFRFSNMPVVNVLPTPGSFSAFYLNNLLYAKRLGFDAYDSKGNILQYNEDGVNTSIIWGYNNLLPIAEAKNASRGSDLVTASQIAYNGFETGADPGEYGWGNVFTSNIVSKATDPSNVFAGNYSFKMGKAPAGDSYWGPTFNLTPPAPQKGKYKLSCWVKTPIGMPSNMGVLTIYTMQKGTCCGAYPNGASSFANFSIPATNNTWQYVELIMDFETIKNSVPNDELALRCFLSNGSTAYEYYVDEIKISPLDAQMTTYSHIPLVGISAKGEAGSLYTKYEYDPLGRLLLIRDSEGNINKRYQYHYKP